MMGTRGIQRLTITSFLLRILGCLSLVAGFSINHGGGGQQILGSTTFIHHYISPLQQRHPGTFTRLPSTTAATAMMMLKSPHSPLQGGARNSRHKITRLYAAPPEIEKWRILDGGSVQGFVRKHPTIADGDVITTSPLKAPNAVGPRMIVTTSSGTKYRLLDPLKQEAKGGTVSVRKFLSGSRKTPSINVGGTKMPIIDDWKVLDNNSVQGYVFNHPTIPDGQVIKTSTLKNPRVAAQKATIYTISGSKYRLGEPEGFVAAAPLVSAPPPPVAAPAVPKEKDVPERKKSGGLFNFFGSSSSSSPVPAKNVSPAPSPVPAKAASASKPVAERNNIDDEKIKAKELKFKLAQAKREYGLNGETLGEGGKYLLSGQPIKSTSGKSLIFKAYRGDEDGLPLGDVERDALTIKLSSNNEALEREASNYKVISRKGFARGQFVELLDYLSADELKSNSKRTSQSALVMERGAQDLKYYLAQEHAGDGLSGKKLREAAAAAAQCVQAAHASGLVWTDMKTENFVVTENGEFRGIDLESAIPVGQNPVDYSPEACPPEFAKAFLAGEGPYFALQKNYDIWSFGMMCYEMATGGGYFDNKSPIQITRALAIMEELEIPDDVEIDGRMKSLIQSCLQVDPKKRPSIAQVMLHPYFLTTGIGPLSF